MLRRLRGRQHQVFTALAVLRLLRQLAGDRLVRNRCTHASIQR